MGCCSHSINRCQLTVSCFLKNSFYSLSKALILLSPKEGRVDNGLEPKFSIYPLQNWINFLLLLFYRQKFRKNKKLRIEPNTGIDLLGGLKQFLNIWTSFIPNKVMRTQLTMNSNGQFTISRWTTEYQILMKFLHQIINYFSTCQRNSLQCSASKLHERHCERSNSIWFLS